MTKRPSLALNTVAQSAPLMVGYIASFVSAPIVLSALGLRQFGIWALTGRWRNTPDCSISASDLAFRDSSPCTKGGNRRGSSANSWPQVYLPRPSSALCSSWRRSSPRARLRTTLEASAVGACSSYFFVRRGSLPPRWWSTLLTSYRVGLRQMVGPNVILTLSPVINFAFSVGAALLSRNVTTYALANAASSAISVMIVVVYACLATEPRAPFSWPRWRTVADLLSFSVKNQMQTVATLVNYQTDKIVIALMIGPAAAAPMSWPIEWPRRLVRSEHTPSPPWYRR